MKLLIQLLVNGLILGGLYSLIALSFGLVYRSTRIFHIALGAVYTISAYGMYVGAKEDLLLGIAAGLTSAILLSLLIEWMIYQPFVKKESSLGVILIASLGVYVFIVNLIALIFGNEVKVISSGIEPSFSLGFLVLTRIQIIEFIISGLIILGIALGFKKSKFFKAIWAMGEEPLLVEVLGLPVFKLRSFVFILSGFLVASAAMLSAYDVGIDPHQGLSAILLGAVAVLVGGVDNLWGWIISAFLISEIQSVAIWKFSAKWNDAITFILLILVLLLKPKGLFTSEGRVEE